MKALLALLVCAAHARFLQPDPVPTAPQLHKPFILDDQTAPEDLAAITQILSKEPAAASAVRTEIPSIDEVNGVTSNDELLDRVGGLPALGSDSSEPAASELAGQDDDLSGNSELVEKENGAAESDAAPEGVDGEAGAEAPLAEAAAAAADDESFETPGEFAEEQKIKRYQELVDHAQQIMELVPKTKERLAELIKKRDEWKASKIVAAAQKKLNRQTELREQVEQKLEELKSQQAELETLRERLDKTMAKLQNVITNKGKLVDSDSESSDDDKDDKEDDKEDDKKEEEAKDDTAAEEAADDAEEKEKEKDEQEDKEDEKKGDDDEAVTHAVELELKQLKRKHTHA